jgi:hypothetical protein
MYQNEELTRLLARHQANLNKLREQAAVYAAGTEPLYLLNQIEAEEKTIEQIKGKLEGADGNPFELKQYFSSGFEAELRGDFWEARRYYQLVLQEDPFYPRVQERLESVEAELQKIRLQPALPAAGKTYSSSKKRNLASIISIVFVILGVAVAIIGIYGKGVLSWPVSILTGTPTTSITPTPIDKMDTLWEPYKDTIGSAVTDLKLTREKTDQATAISYNLLQGGHVGIFKEFYPGLLSGTERIGFWYKGRGASNTLEFKLLHAEEVCANGNRRRAVFSVEWANETNTGDEWVFKEVNYDDFRYWAGNPNEPDNPPTGCAADVQLDLDKVDKIDFAISSRPHFGDESGEGVIVIDDVQAW